MKQISHYPFAFVTCVVCILSIFKCNSTYAQELEVITYTDTYADLQGLRIAVPMLPKTQRLSNKASIINPFYANSDLPTDIKKSIDYAFTIWESHIENSIPLNIEFRYENISDDLQTDVVYRPINGTMTPNALAIYQEGKRMDDSKDGIITINKNVSWDCSVGENIPEDKKNLTTGILRAICRILGFGSSIKVHSSGDCCFGAKTGYSLFDKLIISNDNKRLTDITLMSGRPNPELTAFVNASNRLFYIGKKNNDYKLASGPYTEVNPPLTLIETGLMSQQLITGNYNLQIDETTLRILKNLGWNTKSAPEVEIQSNDISQNGLASAYISHRFYINTSASITNPEWSFRIPLKNGQEKILSLQDNNHSCSIPAIDDETLYNINVDGVIPCHLEFSCTINGQNVTASPFTVHWELKPFIERASILKIVDNSPYTSYDAHYEVVYTGADRIMVSVEEEYSARLKTWYISEPFYATGIADHITSPYYAWIDFIAENQYGKDVYTIELQPYGTASTQSIPLNAYSYHSDSKSTNYIREIHIYDLYGQLLWHGIDFDEWKNSGFHGIAIVKYLFSNNLTKTEKIILR